MIPSVTVNKVDGQTGVAPTEEEDGILAILAPSQSGTENQPTSVTRPSNALTTFGYGPLVDACSYVIPQSQKPVVLVKTDPSTDGAYGTVTNTAKGTATPVAGSSKPLDDYDVLITFVTGGALGTTGITYRYSLDGGKTLSKVLALGTSLTLTIPNSGVSFVLGTSSQTVLANQKLACTTKSPQSSAADLGPALDALEASSLGFDGLYAFGDCDETHIAAIETWMASQEAHGRFRFFICNTRAKDSDETEVEYRDDLEAIRDAGTASRGVVCADSGMLVSPLTKLKQRRPWALGVAARAMALDLSIEPAVIGEGPIPGFSIIDERKNPIAHDEELSPGLDDLKFTTARRVEKRSGVYITNTNVFSPEGSDLVFLPHLRLINKACSIAFDILMGQLSSNVVKKRKANPDGSVNIDEDSALAIEKLVNVALKAALRDRAGEVRFKLNRDDDIGSNAGAKLTGEIELVAFAIVKSFEVNSKFARSAE